MPGPQPVHEVVDDVISLDLEDQESAAEGEQSWRPIDIDASAMQFWEVRTVMPCICTCICICHYETQESVTCEHFSIIVRYICGFH
jgi:hypothetical protein